MGFITNPITNALGLNPNVTTPAAPPIPPAANPATMASPGVAATAANTRARAIAAAAGTQATAQNPELANAVAPTTSAPKLLGAS